MNLRLTTRISTSIGVIMFCSLFFACSSDSEEQRVEYSFGIKEGKYHNSYFNVEIQVDSIWNIVNESEIKKQGDYWENMWQDSLQCSENDFISFEGKNPYKLLLSRGSSMEETPNISIISVWKELLGKDSSLIQYMEGSKAKLELLFDNRVTFSDYQSEKLGNRYYKVRTAAIEAESSMIYQKTYYSDYNENFLFNISITYKDSAEYHEALFQLKKMNRSNGV